MILIVDDDKAIRLSLGLLLRRAGYTVQAADSPEAALAVVRDSLSAQGDDATRLVVMDMNYSGSTTGNDGIELLRRLKVLIPNVPIILITAWASIPLAVEGMRHGAFDFVAKPWDNSLLLQRVETALKLTLPAAEPTEAHPFDRCGIVGRSRGLTDVLDTVRRIAATDASVLILGENGTGKELIAQAIHRNSRRSAQPLVMVNLGGIAQSLFESEMFGHAKGAFTGAVAARKGRFEVADGGTIFLDEIGDLDLSCQVKLLRVLQEHTFEPLGESRPRRVDIRVVCATNADLATMVRQRTFREDLFYRINLITLRLPPLRERREDIPLLVAHFAERVARRDGRDTPEITGEAMTYLSRLPYPGNIRELKNLVERAMLVNSGPTLNAASFSSVYVPMAADNEPQGASLSGATLDELEHRAILAAIEKHGNNVSLIANSLGISRQSLYRRLEKFGIQL